MDFCRELREFYIEVISKSGGHFAAGLGVVELTVALHYLFDSPNDQIVWDVGHQAYVHKILTSRKNALASIRSFNGLSGFPKRDESAHDVFGTGHASTAISATLGLATASLLSGHHLRSHIAVVGDGALTGGLAFEGLNNAGVSQANMVVIVNDNSISIDPAVGALSHHLERGNRQAPNMTRGVADGRTKRRNNPTDYTRHGLKAINIAPHHFFESLNLAYRGPIDGHDLPLLLSELRAIRSLKGPRVLHIKTTKGKGFSIAEKNQVTWHAPGKFDKITGERLTGKPISEKLKYQEAFGQTLVSLAEKNPDLVAITPAMPSGSALNDFIERFPERAFDVGIAEEHAVTFAAGMAINGKVPFCCIYSSFLQRSYDQLIHDVCLQKLPVIFCIDRAGLVGADGPTHHGVFDMAYLRLVPNIVVSAPKDEKEFAHLLYTASLYKDGPFAIRYPRGWSEGVGLPEKHQRISIGKGERLLSGDEIAILAFGNRVMPSLRAIESTKKSIGLYNMRFIKPLDHDLLNEVIDKYRLIITVEDGCVAGGAGSAVLEYLNSQGKSNIVHQLGVPDEFIEHGSQDELYRVCGIDEKGIANKILTLCEL